MLPGMLLFLVFYLTICANVRAFVRSSPFDAFEVEGRAHRLGKRSFPFDRRLVAAREVSRKRTWDDLGTPLLRHKHVLDFADGKYLIGLQLISI